MINKITLHNEEDEVIGFIELDVEGLPIFYNTDIEYKYYGACEMQQVHDLMLSMSNTYQELKEKGEL